MEKDPFSAGEVDQAVSKGESLSKPSQSFGQFRQQPPCRGKPTETDKRLAGNILGGRKKIHCMYIEQSTEAARQSCPSI